MKDMKFTTAGEYVGPEYLYEDGWRLTSKYAFGMTLINKDTKEVVTINK